MCSKPPTQSGNLSDGLDMPIAPRRFNVEGVPSLKARRSASTQLPRTFRESPQTIEPNFDTQRTIAMSHKMGKADTHEPSARAVERKVRAEQKVQEKQAKVAEKRARGAHATEEIVAHIDSRLQGLKHGKLIMETLDNSEIKYRYEFREGELTDWPTITWHRDVATGSGTMQVPYVMIVLHGRQSEDLLSDCSHIRYMTRQVYETFGAVSLSLTFVGLERHLMAKERKEYRSAVSENYPSFQGFSCKKHMHNLLGLHFWAEGIVYRDCKDAAQAAEHVLGITAAIAQQPYKGGEDNVAAFIKKKSSSVTSIGSSVDIPPAQRQVFTALSGAVSIGPQAAKAITNEHQSLGALMHKITGAADKKAFFDAVANLKGGARRVGPAAAKKLQWLLTCEDPNAKIN